VAPEPPPTVPEPRVERTVTLTLCGDTGMAGLHRVCGWISSQVLPRCGPGSDVAIVTGTGFRDNLDALTTGRVDVAVSTPACFAEMARTGRGLFEGAPSPDLRGIAAVPQQDRLVLGVRRDLGIGTFAELRARQPALRIAAERDDGTNFVGWAARRLMEASGVPEATLRAWGGSYVGPSPETPRSRLSYFPGRWIELVGTGDADAVIHEGLSVPTWQDVAQQPGLRFLPLEAAAAAQLRDAFGWRTLEVAAGFFPGLDETIPALDFADFLVACRADLPEDLVFLIAWCLVETRAQFERQFRHLPPERAPVTYPLDPVAMAETPVPLHPGARAYYDELAARAGVASARSA
jgi:TRAP-type uncharacterized transport system substrate-binding protein